MLWAGPCTLQEAVEQPLLRWIFFKLQQRGSRSKLEQIDIKKSIRRDPANNSSKETVIP